MGVVGGVMGCEGYVIFVQDGVRWGWSDEKFWGVWEGSCEGGKRRVTMLPILTALNGRPGACQGVGIEGWVKQGDG